jgi:CRP/FNR family transcriptional regulator, cyclic AMP receptor protein
MSIRTVERLLADHPFFAGMRPEQLAVLAGCASNVHFSRDTYLIHEGDPADTFFIIRSGVVALETMAPQRRTVTIETIEAGEVLGWSWLFPPYRWHFSGRAVEEVSATKLDGACLRGKCEADPALGYELMRRFAAIVIDRLQATRLQLLDLYAAPDRGAR